MPQLSQRRALSLGVLLPPTLFFILLIGLSLRNSARIGDPVLTVPADVLRSGRPAQMLYTLETQAEASGWTGDTLRLAGDLWRELGDLSRAVPYWETAAQRSPSADLHRDIADAYVRLGQWDDAARALTALLESAPPDADRLWAHWQRGLILAAYDPAQALGDLQAASAEPAYAELVAPLITVLSEPDVQPLSVALVLGEVEQWPHAEWTLSSALSQGALTVQSAIRAQAYLAYTRVQQGREADGLLNAAVELAPDDAELRMVSGLYWRERGELIVSRDAFQAAIALDPENPILYAELGSAYQLLGDLEQARYWYERAAALSDGDVRYQLLLDALPPNP